MDANTQNSTPSSAPQRARLTRSGARRQGDEYQDVRALDILVEWLEHSDRYQWVKLEAGESGFLDDILAMRADDVLAVWQVKYSTSSHLPDDAWTWDSLLERRPGAHGPKLSLLQKWFGTWHREVSSGIKISPGLLSNRRAAPELFLDSPRGGRVLWNGLNEGARQNIVAQLGDEAQARDFFEVFRFNVDQPSLRELEEGVRLRFERLGGTPGGWYALEKAVREWVNIKDNPPPDGRVYLDDVRRITKLKAHPLRLRTFLPPPIFFERYMEPHRLFHHRLPMVGRRAQLNDLLSFIDGRKQIALLPGRGGSGKSKLLHTLCRRLKRRRPDLSVRLLAEKLTITEKSLKKELWDENCLVIVDDAHGTVGLELLLEAAGQNRALKVLLVTRPHATDYLVAQARGAGFDRNDIVINQPLPNLNYAHEHRRLARLVLGRDWAHYADQLASVTRDSPLLTILGGELLRTERVAPSFLTRHETFRQEVLSRFRDIQFGLIMSQLDGRFSKELCADVLPLIAVLTPFNLDKPALLQAVARLLGTTDVKLRQLLGALVKAEALVRGSKLVRIIPDVLSDFILQEACFTDDGVPTGWADRVYQEVSDIRWDVMLRNLAELDWRVRTAPRTPDSFGAQVDYETGLLDFVWSDIKERFRAGSLAERKAWFKRLERVASMQPHRLWPLVEIARNEPASEDPEEVKPDLRPWHRPVTQADVLAALASILRGVARDGRFTARCADLLWEMGRELETEPGHSPSAIATLRQLGSYETGKPLAFSHIVLERCRAWLDDPDIHAYRHSVLEVITPMLARRAHSTETDGHWRNYGSYAAPPEPLRALRRGALELVERCALSRERRIVLEALHTLHVPVTEEGLWGLRKEDPSEWQSWEGEVLAALEIVARIARDNDDPFVRLRIWEVLHLQAERGPRPAVQSRAREILEAIPLSFESRFILLVTGNHGSENYRQTWTSSEEDEGDWLKSDNAGRLHIDQKRYRRNEEFARQATREWVERYPDSREGFDALDVWLEQVETSGWWKKFWTRSNPFVLQLAADYPTYARSWCETALEKPEARTTVMCDDLLCELRRQDPEGTLELAQRFLAHGHPNLWLRVAGSYSWRGWPSAPLPEEWQIVRDLLAFPHPQVKRRAAEIVSAIASIDMRRAIDLTLQTNVGEDSELADALFAIFEERRGVTFSNITTDELGRLLDKLKMVENVRSYHVGHFLLQSALRDPIAVVKLLLGRVQRNAELNEERLEEPATDVHAWSGKMVDNYGALPESGFHEDKFNEVANHPDYQAALRLIRDAALSEKYRSAFQYEDTLSELFREFSLHYGPVALEVLNEWINSGDCVKVRSALHLLGDSYLGFYVNNLSFVSNYLGRARECGKAVLDEVEGAMLHNAEYGPPGAISSHRGERSNALFHNAFKALERVKDDPLAVRFFQRLRDRGHELMRSEMRQDAEDEIYSRL